MLAEGGPQLPWHVSLATNGARRRRHIFNVLALAMRLKQRQQLGHAARTMFPVSARPYHGEMLPALLADGFATREVLGLVLYGLKDRVALVSPSAIRSQIRSAISALNLRGRPIAGGSGFASLVTVVVLSDMSDQFDRHLAE